MNNLTEQYPLLSLDFWRNLFSTQPKSHEGFDDDKGTISSISSACFCCFCMIIILVVLWQLAKDV